MEILRFLRWQWRKFELWQRLFIFAMFIQGVGLAMAPPWSVWISGLGAAIVLGYLIKWAVWDNIKASWRRYQEERNQLFKTIRDSDC